MIKMRIYIKTLEGNLKWTEQKTVELSEEYSFEQLKKKKDNLLKHKINLQKQIEIADNNLIKINALIAEATKLGIEIKD